MKNKIIIGIAIIVLIIGSYFTVQFLVERDRKKAEMELQQNIEKYGFVEEENVKNLIDKFNKEIKKKQEIYLASEKYMTTKDEIYWYEIHNDIFCYVEAKEFTEDTSKDIAKTMAIYYDKGSKNEKMALKYVKYLLKANNSELTDEDIEYLIDEAKNKFGSQEVANNGKGICLGYVETEEHIEYQIIRMNEEK